MNAAPEVALLRCGHCHTTFFPRPGACPRCGSTDLSSRFVPAQAVVRAATALEFPATGWRAPHPLLLVELADEVRILAVGFLPLPERGSSVVLTAEQGRYLAHPLPGGERGEGELPADGSVRRPFEPPR